MWPISPVRGQEASHDGQFPNPWRVIALVLSLALAAAACGTNDEPRRWSQCRAPGLGGAPGTSGEPAASAAARQRRADGLGDGQRGHEALGHGRQVHGGVPDVNVSVTPVDWGQAVAKLQTAIGGGETPDISQMGTDMMGQFVETGRPRARRRRHRSERLLRECLADQRHRWSGLWRAVVRRDARPLLPDRCRREGRHHRRADDLGRAQGDGQGHAGAGRRRVGHLARDQERPGVPAVRVVERRRRHRRGRRLRARLPAGRRGARVLRLVLRGGPDPASRSRKASTSRRPSCPARTRCSSPARGMSASSPTPAAPTSKASGPSPRCPRRSAPRRSSVAPTSSSSRTARTRTRPGPSSSSWPTRPTRSRGTTRRPCCPPSRLPGTIRRSRTT